MYADRLTYPYISHYYSAPIIEALYVFGQINPRLFWKYLPESQSTQPELRFTTGRLLRSLSRAFATNW